MSSTDQCTKCGRVGHAFTNCPRYTGPMATHITEPHDGRDGMVRCTDCRLRVVYDHFRRTGCPDFVPAMASLMRRCVRFVPAARTARA